MDYSLDTNTISQIYRFYYRDGFPSFWERFNNFVSTGRVGSVSEVEAELTRRSGLEVAVQDLRRLNPNFFNVPSAEEQQFIGQIFAVPHFNGLISAKARATGTPVADPFVIAKVGAGFGTTVVTEEVFRPNSVRIPSVCAHFSIDCIKLQQLMAREGWRF